MNGQSGNPFDELKKLSMEGREIVFIPNDGNHGDALITAATVQNFERRGIKYTVFRRGFQHRKSHMYVYGGGGNLVPMYRSCTNILEALSRVAADLIILPHSCFGVDRHILEYRGRLKIWARERRTLAYLTSLPAKDLTTEVSHDIALSLDLADPRFYYLSKSRQLRAALPRADRSSLHAFRTDLESRMNSKDRPSNNVDLSQTFSTANPTLRGFSQFELNLERLFMHLSWFLAYVDYFDHIKTDRLHVAIAGCLLNKQVDLFDNSYGKNSAVYEYSLRDRQNIGLLAPAGD